MEFILGQLAHTPNVFFLASNKTFRPCTQPLKVSNWLSNMPFQFRLQMSQIAALASGWSTVPNKNTHWTTVSNSKLAVMNPEEGKHGVSLKSGPSVLKSALSKIKQTFSDLNQDFSGLKLALIGFKSAISSLIVAKALGGQRYPCPAQVGHDCTEPMTLQ